jgi:dUTP pyrophosphatase
VINVKFVLFEGGRQPTYATAGAAGADLYWNGMLRGDSTPRQYIILRGTDRVLLFRTGVAIELPPGWEAQVRPRSSLGLKSLIIANAPGTIDSDYRGEIMVELKSLRDEVRIDPGDRIGQLVFAPAPQVTFEQADTLGLTDRGTKGYGSTGR